LPHACFADIADECAEECQEPVKLACMHMLTSWALEIRQCCSMWACAYVYKFGEWRDVRLACREPMTVYQGDVVVIQYNLIKEQLLQEKVRLT
jgi:hypothetical protein